MTSLHELLVAAAERRPEHPLFVGPGGLRLTYAQALQQALGFAGGLRGLGVEPGDRVAMLLPDRPELLVAFYGALAAGGVAVPLSPDARRRSLKALLARCGARVVVTTGKVARLVDVDALPELRAVVAVGEAPDGVVAWGEALGAPPYLGRRAGDALASIMFTSGTTAEPKGVVTTHGNQLAATRAIVDYLGLQPDERLAMVLPFFYSYGLSVLHTHVAVGGTVCLVGSVAYPAAVLRGIEAHRCTGLSGVPSTFARLAHSKALGGHDLSSLRYLTQAGGPMSPALTEATVRAFPGARLFVMYGQTEAAPRLSYLAPEDLSRKLGSVGKAMPGVTLRVLDPAGEPVPTGEVGELVATGPNVMVGYWEDPEGTARALRSEGLRTGDLARADDEGFLYIVGREGDLIKAGAHRVGPQEIEAAIERLEGVEQCAVVGVPDALEGEAIAAYVVLAPGSELDERALLRHCREELPRHKTPAHFRIVDALPSTDTGKLRRAALRGWFAEGR